MGVGVASLAQGSTHTPIFAGETAERVTGTLRSDAEPRWNCVSAFLPTGYGYYIKASPTLKYGRR